MKIINKIPQAQKVHQWLSGNKAIYFLLLLIQNIVVFSLHLFSNVGFTGDFPQANYAVPAFWTTSVSTGIFPQWIPYQAMGYPLAMNIQSGFYYPVFWIFPLFHIPYTLHDAITLQVFTVLFGSFGMFLLLDSIFKSPRYAFIGAVAFQLFGGFYSQAQNNDIIRGFAIAPWMFYVLKLNTDEPMISRRNLLIPIVIYFLATGGYPGITISSLFIGAVFVFLQILNAYLKDVVKLRSLMTGLKSLKIGGAMVGLMILGLSISIIHLGPFWQERNEVTRLSGNAFQDPNYLYGLHLASVSIKNFPLLFMSPSPLPLQDQPWKSLFISLPLLVFASFVTISSLRKYWIFVVILILSILMVGGLNSPFWQGLTSAEPALKLSRFPASDYRPFVTFPIIILGLAGLKAIVESKMSWKKLVSRAAFTITWFSLGVYLLYLDLYFSVTPWKGGCVTCPTQQVFINFQIASSVVILFATLLVVIYFAQKNRLVGKLRSVAKDGLFSRAALLLIAILVSFNGLLYAFDIQLLWTVRPSDTIFTAFHIPLEKNGKLVTYSIFQNIPNERPARETTDNIQHFSWKGYLLGNYMMSDYTGDILTARSVVESNVDYTKYMFMKWTPLLLDPNLIKSGSTRVTLPEGTFSSEQLSQAQSQSVDRVMQTHYGINDIKYSVTLKHPRLMVENELYFPGWQADLIFPNKEIKIYSLEVNGAFRAWLLPSGNYTMISHFQFPNIPVYESITIISFAIWILITTIYWRRTKRVKADIVQQEFQHEISEQQRLGILGEIVYQQPITMRLLLDRINTYRRDALKRSTLTKYCSLIVSISISDLKIRYKNSFLGFVWTFLQPLLFLGVLYVVFSAFLGNQIPYFPLYLLLGLIMWNMYTRGTSTSMLSFITMSGLLSKVYFPREILPITANITSFIMMLFDLCAFAVFILIFHFVPTWTILYLPLLLIILFILTLGVSFALTVANVYFRDLEHIWGIVLQAGFFVVPIFLKVDIYPPYIRDLLYFNPTTLILDMGHKVAIYNTIPSLHDFGYLILVSFAVLGIGYAIFKKFESKAIELL